MRGLEDVNGTLFFTHVGCVDGTPQGLWKTDGTVGGTVVVKQGIDAFRKFFTLTNVDGTLYFNAFDGGNGFELWKSEIPYNDANTSIVADLIPGPGSSDPLELTDFGGILFFTRLNATGERELWKSGGTAATTEQVSTTTFSASGGISDLTAVNSALFFRADFGSGLWVSDGTEGGTLKIKDVNAQDLTVSNNTLFFNGTDAGGDSELWTSDGTSGGTDVVTQINTTGSSRPSLLTDLGGILVLAADDGAVGKELWRSNGTAGGTELVRDINLEQGSSKPTLLTDVDGKLFFSADDGTGRELWESNGEELGTIAISAPEHPDLLTNVDGTLYFVTPADELWKSNQSGEALVKSFAGIGQIREMIDFDGTLYLAVDGLWKSDGTGTGTEKVTNSVSFPRSLTESGGKLFFSGTDTGGDEELWKVEGTNTVEVEDIRASGSSRPGDLVDVNGTLFFDADDGQVGRELWKSDGTAAGTQPILDINPAGSAFFGLRQPVGTRPTNVDGELYFVAFDGGATGSELWKSDGLGATLIKDINMSGPSFPGFTNFGGMVDVGGILFFVASDGLSGFELWRSDGTMNNTYMVKDINPGPASSAPSSLTNVEGTLVFAASDGLNGMELWESDGTEAGTKLVQDIFPGANSSSPGRASEKSEEFTISGEKLFFSASDDTTCVELWAAPVAAFDNFESATAGASESVDVSVAPLIPGDAGVSATLTNDASGSPTVTVENFSSNPGTLNVIDVGGGYVDLKVEGADSTDEVNAKFYSSSNITGSAETSLQLLYFDGIDTWLPVTPQVKDTTNDLDGTSSGGRFSVTFDDTSTPAITDLTGTVFTFSVPPADGIEALIDQVIELDLPNGISNSLESKLKNAHKKLTDGNPNNDGAAINKLNAFINDVEAQRGNHIPEPDADMLIAGAEQIIAVLESS